MSSVLIESELTCPECGHQELLDMPTNACQWFHECADCHVLLKPEPEDCCVFCSYGTNPCPPIQLEKAGLSVGGCCSGRS